MLSIIQTDLLISIPCCHKLIIINLFSVLDFSLRACRYAFLAMAFISHTSWLIILSLLCGISTSSVIQDLQLSTFECDLEINNVKWNLQCQSVNSESQSSKFFLAMLYGIAETTESLNFRGLLNSTSFFESELYQCDNMWRSIISIDRQFVIQNCANFTQYLNELSNVLNESSVMRIIIAHTSKSVIILDMLSEFSRLDYVKICDNNFQNITKLLVHPDNRQRTLILRYDNIENVAEDVFTNLSYLLTLDLSHNALKYIDKNFFGNVTTISSLDLSFNSIHSISSDAFQNLRFLRNLFIQNNNLKCIDENIFQHNNLLNTIELSNNEIKVLPPKIFHILPGLKNISCSNCSLAFIDKDLFAYSENVLSINFAQNFIREIHEDMFKDLNLLEYLDFGCNNISYLNINFLPNHAYMNLLNLSHNSIEFLPNGIFSHAQNIHFLDISNNKLKVLTDKHVQNFTDLEYLYLRQNFIENVELGKNGYIRIRRIFLADNIIVNFNVTWKKLIYLENVELDNNKLTRLEIPPCIPSVKQTITFSFTRNYIAKVNMDSLLFDERKVESGVKMDGCRFNGLAKNFIDLTRNPLVCDCDLYLLYDYIKSPRKYPFDMFLNIENLTCAGPQLLNNRSLPSLSFDDFSCSFTNTCPQPCTCGVRAKDSMTFVNCSGKGLTKVPSTAPNGTTVLYFNNNKLWRMQCLNIKVWSSLKELHVDNNSLTDLKDWAFPPTLIYLSVRGNKLKTLPSSLMQFISKRVKFQLYLGGNDNNCTCDRETLKDFLVKNRNHVMDLENIVCKVINGGTSDLLPLISIPDNALCPTNSSQMTLIITLCVFFLVLISVLLLYYKYRQLILSFLYVYCDELFHLCYFEDEYDEDNFDAFVAYSSSDRDIVMDMLQELEDNPPYFNLCIHERNWLPGQFISDNIINSVQNSRRTIIVLSYAFISSPWFNLELRAAVFKMSKDKMNKIIVVLADKSVSLTSIEPELRHVISRRTYLVWGERWFWEKMRYAMPRKKHRSKSGRGERSERSTSEMSLVPTSVE